MLEHTGRKEDRRLQEMSQVECPACGCKIYQYRDGKWIEWICWTCGYYESDTPAFKAHPYLFRDVVRRNGNYFLVKYAFYGRAPMKNPGTSGS